MRSRDFRVSRSELVLVATMLLGVFVLRLVFSHSLAFLMEAFNQYNLFLDADPNQYVNGISHGRDLVITCTPDLRFWLTCPCEFWTGLLAGTSFHISRWHRSGACPHRITCNSCNAFGVRLVGSMH